MQSDSSSSSSSFEVIAEDIPDKFDEGELLDSDTHRGLVKECHLEQIGETCTLYVNSIPVNLPSNGELNYSLVHLNSIWYLRSHGELNRISITGDGLPKLHPEKDLHIQYINDNKSWQLPKSEADENSLRSKTDLRMEDMSQGNLKSSITAEQDSLSSHFFLPLSYSKLQSENTKLIKETIDETNSLSHHVVSETVQKIDTTVKDNIDFQTRTVSEVKLIRTDKGWVLCVGTKETELNVDQAAKATLEKDGEDIYISVDNELFEIKIKPNSEFSIVRIDEAKVIPASTNIPVNGDRGGVETRLDVHKTKVIGNISGQNKATDTEQIMHQTLPPAGTKLLNKGKTDEHGNWSSNFGDKSVSELTEMMESMYIKDKMNETRNEYPENYIHSQMPNTVDRSFDKTTKTRPGLPSDSATGDVASKAFPTDNKDETGMYMKSIG